MLVALFHTKFVLKNLKVVIEAHNYWRRKVMRKHFSCYLRNLITVEILFLAWLVRPCVQSGQRFNGSAGRRGRATKEIQLLLSTVSKGLSCGVGAFAAAAAMLKISNCCVRDLIFHATRNSLRTLLNAVYVAQRDSVATCIRIRIQSERHARKYHSLCCHRQRRENRNSVDTALCTEIMEQHPWTACSLFLSRSRATGSHPPPNSFTLSFSLSISLSLSPSVRHSFLTLLTSTSSHDGRRWSYLHLSHNVTQV